MSRPHVRVCVTSESARANVSFLSWLSGKPQRGPELVTMLAMRAMSARLIAGWAVVAATTALAALRAGFRASCEKPQYAVLRIAARTRGCRVFRLTIPARTGALL